MKADARYRPRLLTPRVEAALRTFPVVVVTGARQVGKSTLAQHLPSAPRRIYRTLDDLDVLEQARDAPDRLCAAAPRLTLDEVQRVPEFLLAVKRSVDRERRAGRFLLTGSANLLLLRSAADSLAGRAVYVTVRPFTESEKRRAADAGPWTAWLRARSAREALQAAAKFQHPSRAWATSVLGGCLPPPALLRGGAARRSWYDGYVRTYLERDLQQLVGVTALSEFRRLMQVAALRLGQLLNQADLARDAGLAPATAHRYLGLLEVSHQVLRIPAYSVNRTRRLIKTPKLYWADPGLAAHLGGFADPEGLSRHASGGYLENLVLLQLLVWADLQTPSPQICYWRTAAGAEVDLVVEWGRRLLPVEVTSGDRVRSDDLKGLHAFLDEYADTAPFGIVLYGGGDARLVSEKVAAVPLGSVL